jgi:hypothetical protein
MEAINSASHLVTNILNIEYPEYPSCRSLYSPLNFIGAQSVLMYELSSHMVHNWEGGKKLLPFHFRIR